MVDFDWAQVLVRVRETRNLMKRFVVVSKRDDVSAMSGVVSYMDKGAKPGGDVKPLNSDGGGANVLMTFREPKPSALMGKVIVPVVRWLGIYGIKGLRSVPGLNRIVGIRGISNIVSIDFPTADEQRLADALSSDNATFVTPNHPEFFTDWLLDRVIVGRSSPKAAYWATHAVVNGMGPLAQRFWLANNLIAQIPGGAGKAGKEYSIEHALSGHGVLLHAEGNVGWHGDLIGHLFSGAVDMAMEAAKRAEDGRKAFVAPIVWKLVFTRDVARGLHREFDLVERILDLRSTRVEFSLAKRLYAVYSALLARDELKYNVETVAGAYFVRHEGLVVELLARLQAELDDQGVAPVDTDGAGSGVGRDMKIRRGEVWLRDARKGSAEARRVRGMCRDLRRLLRFRADIYRSGELSQEHIAESIKRIRNDYCTTTTRDLVNKYVPQPVGPRRAIVRVPEPLDVSAGMATQTSAELVMELRKRMQDSLDGINRELVASGQMIYEPNPFAGGRES